MNEELRERDEEIEIDLLEVLHLFLKKWWMILGMGLICGALAFGGTKMFITPQYEASSMIYLLSKSNAITSALDIQIGKQMTADFSTLATSRPVVEKVIKELQLDTSYDSLVKQIKISNPEDTQILKITVRDTDPEVACKISNAMADATADRVAEVMVTERPNTVEEAVVPDKPVAPSALKNTIIAGALGCMLVMGLILINYMIDDRIKTEEDIEKYLGLNTLAAIPFSNESKAEKERQARAKRRSAKASEK